VSEVDCVRTEKYKYSARYVRIVFNCEVGRWLRSITASAILRGILRQYRKVLRQAVYQIWPMQTRHSYSNKSA
jgi:hypothetical protein